MSLLDGIFPDIVKDLNEPSFLGTTCTFSVQNSSVYNPLTGQESVTTKVSQSINCSPPLNYEKKYIDGTMIKQGDLKLYVSQPDWSEMPSIFGSEPTDKMDVTIRSKKYAIINVKPLSTGDIDCSWELQLRSA